MGHSSSAVPREVLLEGPITRGLLRLAWPTVLTAALQGFAAALDGIMVARLGESPTAAVTASRQVLMVVLVAGGAVAASTGILVAQAIGRNARDEANHIATQALVVFCGLSMLVLVPVGWYFTPWLLGALTRQDPRVMALGVPYMRVIVVSLLPTLGAFAGMGALRGAGDTRTPLTLTVWTNILTFVANYLMIFGNIRLHIPAMGVMGAAWGNMLSRTIVVVVLYSQLYRGGLALRLEHFSRWRPDWTLLRAMFRLGLPHGGSSVLLNVWGMLVINILYRTDQARAAVAAYGLSMLMRNFGTWVTWGFSEATMAMVGQNIGAGQTRRASHVGFAATRVAAVYLLPVSVLLAATAPWVLSAMFKEDPAIKLQVVRIGVMFLWTQVIALPFLGVGMSLEGALRGTGDTVAPLQINLLSLYLVGMPSSLLLAVHSVPLWGHVALPGAGLGPTGVWLGMSIGIVARGCHAWWRWVRWTRRYVTGVAEDLHG